MNKWKHITGLIFLWLLFSTGTLLCLFQFVFDYGKVKVVVDYTDYKKEDITIYWATNTSWANGSNWTEENHLTKTTGIGRYSYTFYIRHTDTITCISIDPDEACDSCILHSISVEGIQHPFSCSDFSKNKHYNSSVSQQKDGLKIYRDRDSDDPYVIVPVPANDGAVLYHWKGYEIILIVLVLLFDISVLIFLFRFRFLMTFFQKQQMSKIFFVFAFLLCISMYWTDRVLDFYPQQPNIENRKLVKFPKWKTLINKTESFFIDCTQWCSDYFNFRNMLIEARSMAYLKILNETPMPELVKLGKNNMLFPAFEPCLQDFTGTLQFSEKQLNDICTYTKEKNDVLARDSITFWLILVPLKLTVYFDLLPDYYSLRQHKPSFLDLVTSKLNRKHINFISLADTLLNLRLQNPEKKLFYDYDTHWNEYGAFKCYQKVMDAFCRKDSALIPPLRDNEITIDTIEDNQADLAKCFVVNDIYRRKKYRIEPLVKDSISAEIIIEKKRGATIIYRNPHGHGRAIFYRDSYTTQWAPFFAHQFNECILLNTHFMNLQEIKKYKPDIVIEEVGEFLINHLLIPISGNTSTTHEKN